MPLTVSFNDATPTLSLAITSNETTELMSAGFGLMITCTVGAVVSATTVSK